MFRLVLGLAFLMGAGIECRADAGAILPVNSLYEDSSAGVRLRLPFAVAKSKTPQQAQNLIMSGTGLSIPAEAVVTSALYSEQGVPYLLIWRFKSDVTPTLGDIARMAALLRTSEGAGQGRAGGLQDWQFDQSKLRGVATLTLPKAQLQARIMLQLVSDGAVFVAYYYVDKRDAQAFDRVIDGLTLTSAKILRPLAVGSKRRELWRDLAIALSILLIVGGFTTWYKLRRRPS
ncbi:MAG: hypothetical protein NTY08_09990 [Proteobacteria bacterium]|nr:hypothetical protein [Pseudomonadota bacterium]